jgi:hypothetical protein
LFLVSILIFCSQSKRLGQREFAKWRNYEGFPIPKERAKLVSNERMHPTATNG